MLKTREIVFSIPAGKKTVSARHALQSAQIAPRPRPMSPAGLPVPEYLAFSRKVLVRREKKWTQVRKNDKQTYKYIQGSPSGCGEREIPGPSRGETGVTGNTRISVVGGNVSHGLAYCSKERVVVGRNGILLFVWSSTLVHATRFLQEQL